MNEPHGGARSMGFGDDIIDFSTSVNPLGAHQAVVDMLKDAAREVSEYPDAEAKHLEERLATYAGATPDMIVAGNGATQIIYDVCRIAPAGDILVPAPTFGEYAQAASMMGRDVRHLHTIDMAAETQQFIEAIDDTGCVFVCNPPNPTGSTISRSVITEIVSAAVDMGVFTVIDECFMEMSVRNESVMDWAPYHHNVIVLRSMTKSFGLAGLRVGYCVADTDVADSLRNIRVPWSVNGLAQVAGVVALQHPEHVQEGRDYAQQEISYMQDTIRQVPGIKLYHTDTNYMLIQTAAPARIVQDRLLKHNILVRDCSSFDGLDSNHIRIGVRRRHENATLAGLLKRTCPR